MKSLAPNETTQLVDISKVDSNDQSPNATLSNLSSNDITLTITIT